MTDDTRPADAAADSPTAGETEDPAARKSTPPVTALLIFAGAAVLGGLVVMGMKSTPQPEATTAPHIAALQAEIDASREALNRQLVASGRAPLAGEGEPVEDIAARLQKDSAALVALAATFQQTIAGRNEELTAAHAGLIESEKARQALNAELANLTTELRQARIEASAADLLRRELAAAKARNETLTADLAAARSQLSTTAAGVSAEEHADLQRRFDETLRAKEFYEDQVKQLQAAGAKPD